jgi:hypothetical protein
MQRIHGDDARARLRGKFDQVLQIGKVTDAPVAP